MDLQDLFQPLAGDDEQVPDKESPLKSLKKDLDFYSDSIKEVAIEIMAEGLSSYPIFVAHQHEVALGELILDKHDLGTSWSIQASMMEEFIEKGVIKEEFKDRFIKTYKKPEDFMCLFVVVPEGANYVFYPYK
ncbi:hypothetical protein SAMN05216436_12231 [bacterium A37T11]|nr:hypothetical protein SAMN05216436_12231 [bacterium A37T11]